jgi:glycosyltransferase involved in cell wall biosynthesis
MRTLSLFWWETLSIQRTLKSIRPDLVHAWGTERGAALVASRLPYKTLVTMQGLLEWYAERVELDFYTRMEAKLERVSLRRALVVTAESRFAVGWLQGHYPRLKIRQVEHAPGWPFHRLVRRPELNPLQFLFVGKVGRVKGTDLLLKALDQLKDELNFQLTIVSGEAAGFMGALQAETSAKLWDRVTLLTDLTQPEVVSQMAKATIMLFPTRVDNSPNSVKEAVVAGLPVVASAIGGITDYVIAEKNGLLFPAANLEALVQTIRAAAAHPLFKRGEVDQQTLEQMRAYLSPKAMADGFLAAYHAAQTHSVADRRETKLSVSSRP